jgi:ankyrin repeat protein
MFVDALLDGGAEPNRRSLVAFGDLGISMGQTHATRCRRNQRKHTAARNRKTAAGSGCRPGIRLSAPRSLFTRRFELLDLAISLDAAERVDTEGDGCMHLAAWAGHAYMVEQLVRDGHDPNAANTAGRLPLDRVLARNKYGAALAL